MLLKHYIFCGNPIFMCLILPYLLAINTLSNPGCFEVRHHNMSTSVTLLSLLLANSPYLPHCPWSKVSLLVPIQVFCLITWRQTVTSPLLQSEFKRPVIATPHFNSYGSACHKYIYDSWVAYFMPRNIPESWVPYTLRAALLSWEYAMPHKVWDIIHMLSNTDKVL
jgi:hypothetical protein